jgi:hypothetical protein
MDINETQSILSRFGLTYEQTRLMFSIQLFLTAKDATLEKNEEKKKKKMQWMIKWKKSIEEYLMELGAADKVDPSSFKLYDKIDPLKEGIFTEKTRCSTNRFPVFLMLLEVTLYRPYYNLGDESSKQNIFSSKLEVYSKEDYRTHIKYYAKLFGVDDSIIDKFNDSYNSAVKGISKYWQKILIGGLAFAVICAITAGFAAPAIAAVFAPAGLSGAAAVAAGLAALGGGALAAGGLGMAGGLVVIVGGGAIVGAASGLGVSAVFSNSSSFALSQSAKLEVVVKEIVLNSQQDIRFAQEILKEQRRTIEALEDELFAMKHSSEQNREKIKTLEESISYLRISLERMKK